jgi:hypothetical protein
MMWWTLASSLTAHLSGAIPSAEIVIGAAGGAPAVPTIRVRMADDDDLQPVKVEQYKGSTVIRLECWQHDIDSSTAYAELSALNDAVLAALKTWTPANIEFDDLRFGISFDDDLFRPVVGNLVTLSVQWRRTNYL